MYNKIIRPIGEAAVLKYMHFRSTNDLICIRVENPGKVESVIEFILTPASYLFAGKTITQIQKRESKQNQDISYSLIQTYNYNDKFFLLKVVAAIIALPLSLLIGLLAKKLLQLAPAIKKRNQELMKKIKEINIDQATYQRLGVFSDIPQVLVHKNIVKPALTPYQSNQVEALKEINTAFTVHGIAFWIDCGTALGGYRHGGMIPWDNDVDVSILEIDHQNAINALRAHLDPKKYEVLDWSSFDHPQTYIRVHIKSINSFVDVYHYQVDEQKNEAHYFFSFRDSPFVPEKDKRREFACEKPIALGTLFPLQHAKFETVTAPCPNDIETFLHSKYGENISPAKIWNPETSQFDKVEGHPYWKQSYF